MLILWDLPLYHWRLPGNHPEAIPCTIKDRKKVNVFGAISFKGPSEFAVIFLKTNYFFVIAILQTVLKIILNLGFSTEYG